MATAKDQTDEANLKATGQTGPTEAELAAKRNEEEAAAKDKADAEAAKEKSDAEAAAAAKPEGRTGPTDHVGDKTRYTEEERQALDKPTTFVTSRGHDQVLRQHEEVARAKDELNAANEEGHAKNMERIEKEAELIQSNQEDFVASGVEENRNTPRINADGSKVWG